MLIYHRLAIAITIASSLTLAPLTLAQTDTTTAAVGYQAEIVASVVDPCILGIARAQPGLAEMADETIIELSKIMQADGRNEIMVATLKVVFGQPPEARRILYQLFLDQCIKGGTGG